MSSTAPQTSMVRFRLLGGLDVAKDGRPWPNPPRTDTQRLLAYLLLHSDFTVSRTSVAFTLWPDVTEVEALAHLRRHVHRLAQALPERPPGAPWLARTTRSLRWAARQGTWLDVEVFEQDLRRAELQRAENQIEAARSTLVLATDLWRGDLLPDMPDEWLHSQRERLRGRWLQALEMLAALHEACGASAEARQACRRALDCDPTREAMQRRLMLLLGRDGDRGAALAQYEACRGALAAVGLTPQDETCRVADLIRSGQPIPDVTAHQAPSMVPRNAAVDTRRSTLPRVFSALVGRSGELAEIEQRLATQPLITLVGPGGTGKSRLATELAWRVQDRYEAGVWWLSLADLGEGQSVALALAASLGVPAAGSQDVLRSLIAYLRQAHTLIVLDNCEHVVAAVAGLVLELLAACPDVRCLATSREPLGVDGEQVVRVQPLSVPRSDPALSVEEILATEAVQLFVNRATMAWPEYRPGHPQIEAVAGICRYLDGIPLAVELAAARLGVLSEREIEERLPQALRLLRGRTRFRPARHEAMDATIDWSYQLLSPDDQQLFRWLSVFAGGFSLSRAVAVCAAAEGLSEPAVLDGLARLIDKSLVEAEARPDGRRYRILEVLRQFGHQRLVEAGEAACLEQAHAHTYLTVAEAAEPHLGEPDMADWLPALDNDRDNLRSAMHGAVQRREVTLALRMGGALWRYWYFRDYVHEERDLLEQALADATSAEPLAVLAKAQTGAGGLAYSRMDMLAACRWQAASAASYRLLNDRPSLAAVLGRLAVARFHAGDHAGAVQAGEEAVALWRAVGDVPGLAYGLTVFADILARIGLRAQAAGLYSEALQLHERAGSASVDVSRIQSGLAALAHHDGDLARARALTEQVLAHHRTGETKGVVLMTLLDLGRIAADQGDYETAKRVQREALALATDVGNEAYAARALHNLGEVALRQADHDTARLLLRKSLSLKEQHDDPWSQLYTRIALAELAVERSGESVPWAAIADLVVQAGEVNDPALAAWSLRVRVKAAMLADPGPAWSAALRDYLRSCRADAPGREQAIAVELAAMHAAAAGRAGDAGRLVVAADHARDGMGAPRTAWEHDAVRAITALGRIAAAAGETGATRDTSAPESLGAALDLALGQLEA